MIQKEAWYERSARQAREALDHPRGGRHVRRLTLNETMTLVSIATMVVTTVAMVWLAMFVASHTGQEDSRSVPCPTEDDCTVDYYQGAWHVGVPGSMPQ